MIVDFKIQEDEFGYYVIAYRILNGVEQQYPTLRTISSLFDMSVEDMKEYIITQFDSDKTSKNYKMHFQDYEKARNCVEGFRKLLERAIATNHLKLS